MSDLISRQAAIDALKNRWKKTRNYEGIGDDIAEECELYLKQLPSAQPEQRWIPCSERLPEIGKQVLCCDSQSRVFTSALTEIASNGMTFFGQHCKVIAWMPLPEPYKAESEVQE